MLLRCGASEKPPAAAPPQTLKAFEDQLRLNGWKVLAEPRSALDPGTLINATETGAMAPKLTLDSIACASESAIGGAKVTIQESEAPHTGATLNFSGRFAADVSFVKSFNIKAGGDVARSIEFTTSNVKFADLPQNNWIRLPGACDTADLQATQVHSTLRADVSYVVTLAVDAGVSAEAVAGLFNVRTDAVVATNTTATVRATGLVFGIKHDPPRMQCCPRKSPPPECPTEQQPGEGCRICDCASPERVWNVPARGHIKIEARGLMPFLPYSAQIKYSTGANCAGRGLRTPRSYKPLAPCSGQAETSQGGFIPFAMDCPGATDAAGNADFFIENVLTRCEDSSDAAYEVRSTLELRSQTPKTRPCAPKCPP
jgi:hypothetical protein